MKYRQTYDPSSGRFGQEEPAVHGVLIIPEYLNAPARLNAYSYVLDNPINYYDPQGMQDQPGQGQDDPVKACKKRADKRYEECIKKTENTTHKFVLGVCGATVVVFIWSKNPVVIPIGLTGVACVCIGYEAGKMYCKARQYQEYKQCEATGGRFPE